MFVKQHVSLSKSGFAGILPAKHIGTRPLNLLKAVNLPNKNQETMPLMLRPSLFWDVDVHTIDLEKHKASIIERIVTRGRWEEFQEMLRYYGRPTVEEVLLNARWLDKRTLAFCSAIFQIAKTEFRCYKLAQLNPEHWDY